MSSLAYARRPCHQTIHHDQTSQASLTTRVPRMAPRSWGMILVLLSPAEFSCLSTPARLALNPSTQSSWPEGRCLQQTCDPRQLPPLRPPLP